jgi:hypothetical protein
MLNNEINATMEENLEWFKINSSKLIADYPRINHPFVGLVETLNPRLIRLGKTER